LIGTSLTKSYALQQIILQQIIQVSNFLEFNIDLPNIDRMTIKVCIEHWNDLAVQKCLNKLIFSINKFWHERHGNGCHI
jgi:hypothetical protein